MSTPHNSAKLGDIAKVVLMPGDPLRAKHIAETFLTDVRLVNSVRNCLAFTGKYKGKEVTVMASGMGIPSLGIYSTELYNQYGVETIIRIGSCGSYQEKVDVYDLIVVQGACTDSNFGSQFLPHGGTFSAVSDFDLCYKAYTYAKEHGMRVHAGNILSSDIFYHANPEYWKQWRDMNVLGVEMESYGLFATAAHLHKKALCILTVSDSFITHKETTHEERQNKLNQMVEVALEVGLED